MFLIRCGRYVRSTMSGNSVVMERLEQRAQQADQIIARLKSQLNELKKAAVSNNGGKEASLQAENTELQAEVQRALKRLVALETSHGVIQIPLPRPFSSQANGEMQESEVKVQMSDPVLKSKDAADQAKPAPKTAKTDKKEKKEKKEKADVQRAATDEPSITQVDLRIGRIIDVKKHPDADTLYLEQVDLGEADPRTVVSGLVKHVTLEEMQDRLVIMCCNLKPAKMRGVLSQAMVMCAATDDKVEILIPPKGVVPGDRVSCQGYPLADNFPPQMNPKKKIFEQVKPHLRTDANKVACYKGSPLEVEGKGVCVAPTLSKAEVR
ncbi:aminoacyl tRNA synthase complex-interacting multifunctional protein 1-like isoform X1 [Patiria miniata]|uniref:tRNA-binding domain-containing protein n=2 Tax=Patiria miniata TaxID=46514 RepID=A0A913ZXV9_PATMI|nr:aminoacyl tRNA synthase complex-interacting multifunctional protein 1-like isoform X1 [Patiria miniata]